MSSLAPSSQSSAVPPLQEPSGVRGPRRSARRSSGRSRAATLHSQGRKLATRAERLEAERRAAESRVQETIVTDAEMGQVFAAYSRMNSQGVRTIIPLHFSTIWRLVSGDKGNLFSEMQTFQTYDSYDAILLIIVRLICVHIDVCELQV